ncbi:alpha-galactosidase A [Venturia nashicola]|nr:alpha-galactosidase A [Venturia nashicola]
MQVQSMSRQPTLLHCHMDPDGTHVDRYLFHDGEVRYIEIPKNTYPHPSHPGPLPPVLPGAWNWAILGIRPASTQVEVKTPSTKSMKRVWSSWHTAQFNHQELRLYNTTTHKASDNVFMPPQSDKFNRKKVVVKLAHTEHKIKNMEKECAVYQQIQNLGIAPDFLGYHIEGSRKIGFIIERIEGARNARKGDEDLCEAVLRRLHGQGIVHKDCHRSNFLIKGHRAFLIDFGDCEGTFDMSLNAEKFEKAKTEDLEKLRKSLECPHEWSWEDE